MKKSELYELSFEEAVEGFYEEIETITTYEILKDFAKAKIDDDDILLALHIIEALNNGADYYDYDYTCGTLDIPKPLVNLEDLERYCESYSEVI